MHKTKLYNLILNCYDSKLCDLDVIKSTLPKKFVVGNSKEMMAHMFSSICQAVNIMLMEEKMPLTMIMKNLSIP